MSILTFVAEFNNRFGKDIKIAEIFIENEQGSIVDAIKILSKLEQAIWFIEKRNFLMNSREFLSKLDHLDYLLDSLVYRYNLKFMNDP